MTFVTRKFGNVERNSHCDVLHITPIRVARLFLDCNGDFAIKAYNTIYAPIINNKNCFSTGLLISHTVNIIRFQLASLYRFVEGLRFNIAGVCYFSLCDFRQSEKKSYH